MTQRIRSLQYNFPRTWLGRLAGGIAAAALLVSAFFFLFFFLLVAGVAIAGIALRLLWQAKKRRRQEAADVLEGEFTVEQREKLPPE